MRFIQRVGTRCTGYDDAERFWGDAFTNKFEVAAHGGLLGDVEEEALPGAGLESYYQSMCRGEEEEQCRSPSGARHGARRLA